VKGWFQNDHNPRILCRHLKHLLNIV
jgi:hypothetical protein